MLAFPKGPCTHIVYAFGPKEVRMYGQSIYYVGIWTLRLWGLEV